MEVDWTDMSVRHVSGCSESCVHLAATGCRLLTGDIWLWPTATDADVGREDKLLAIATRRASQSAD